jgi:hypothetical protein
MELKPCPVCGKQPKIKYYGVNYATAECKPLFRRKEHFGVFTGYTQPSKLTETVIELWNKGADWHG